MIRLVIVTDDRNVIGHSNLDDYFERASNWSEEKIAEINRIFAGDYMAVGRTTLPLCLDYIPNYKDFYVLTQDPDQYKTSNEDVTFTSDYQKLIKEHQFSDEVFVVGGGKSTWQLFLPFAKEIVICKPDEGATGDIVFDDWQALVTDQIMDVKWNGGTTHYYSVK